MKTFFENPKMDGDRLCNAFWSPESKQTEKVRGTPISLLVSHVYKRKRGKWQREMRGRDRERETRKKKRRGRERECETERKKREGATWWRRWELHTHTHKTIIWYFQGLLDCRMEVSFLVHTLPTPKWKTLINTNKLLTNCNYLHLRKFELFILIKAFWLQKNFWVRFSYGFSWTWEPQLGSKKAYTMCAGGITKTRQTDIKEGCLHFFPWSF